MTKILLDSKEMQSLQPNCCRQCLQHSLQLHTEQTLLQRMSEVIHWVQKNHSWHQLLHVFLVSSILLFDSWTKSIVRSQVLVSFMCLSSRIITHSNPGFSQVCPHGYLFSSRHIWITVSRENCFKFLKLLTCEVRSLSSLSFVFLGVIIISIIRMRVIAMIRSVIRVASNACLSWRRHICVTSSCVDEKTKRRIVWGSFCQTNRDSETPAWRLWWLWWDWIPRKMLENHSASLLLMSVFLSSLLPHSLDECRNTVDVLW